MVKRILISVISPILIFIGLVAFGEVAGNYEIANFITVWPLHVLNYVGVFGNSPEGFYNEWYTHSLSFSLLTQMSALFVATKYFAR